MSYKVLIIPEDPTLNGYILRPLLKQILADAGKPKAEIKILSNPKVQGYNQALQTIKEDLPSIYSHFDLWVFMPDSDRMNSDAKNHLEEALAQLNINLICSPAVPEIEIYPCLAYRKEIQDSWKTMRSSDQFKEEYFAPLIAHHGNPRAPGNGREAMMRNSLVNPQTLYQFCPELKDLKEQISQQIQT